MAGIKTKDSMRGPIKQLNKTAIASQRMKNAYIQTKEKAETSVDAKEATPEEYAIERIKEAGSEVTSKGVNAANSQIRKTGHNAKEKIQEMKENRLEKKPEFVEEPKKPETSRTRSISRKGQEMQKTSVKAVETERKGIKTANRTAKTVDKSVKEGKITIKTSEATAKTAEKGAEATAKASKKAAETARRAAVATEKAVVAATKAVIAAVKAMVSSASSLIVLLCGGGAVLVVILVVCMIGLVVGSPYGLFFCDQGFGESLTLHSVIMEINADYTGDLQTIRGYDYDRIEISGSRATWREVLAVYSVQADLCQQDGTTAVATMNEENRQLLIDVFWMMNYIDTETEYLVEEVQEATENEDGTVTYTTVTQEVTLLKVTVKHVDPYDMAASFDFTEEQYANLDELLDPKNDDLWRDFLADISYCGDTALIDVAMAQLGQQGGEPYWSWFGCTERIPWCACFVSWCANQCGYIDSGVIPKYSWCDDGLNWFKNNNLWLDGSETPAPGMIIFFDWHDGDDNRGVQDGISDHTGIVTNVDENYVYTIEGNTSDSVQEHSYAIGRDDIMGYGMPEY